MSSTMRRAALSSCQKLCALEVQEKRIALVQILRASRQVRINPFSHMLQDVDRTWICSGHFGTAQMKDQRNISVGKSNRASVMSY